MTTGTIAKALRLADLMGAQNIAEINQMQASQSWSNTQSGFAHDSGRQGEKMATLARVMQWIQLATIILTPLTCGAGFVAAGAEGALGTAASLISAGAQITVGSSTAGTQVYKADLDSQMVINKGAINMINHNSKTDFDSIKHESETQIKIGGDIAQMIFNEGQIGSQKIIGK